MYFKLMIYIFQNSIIFITLELTYFVDIVMSHFDST